MECSRCPFSGDVSAGMYKDAPWDETPCAACVAADVSCGGRGKLHYRLDEGRAGADAPALAASDGGGAALCDNLPVSVLADAVNLLMRLPRDVLEVFRLRYSGPESRLC